MSQNLSTKLKSKKTLIIAVLAFLALAGVVVAAVVVTAPEHITGTPTDKPTPTPTASPTPSPSPTPVIELHLSSNVTVPFYKGDTLHLTAQLSTTQTGVLITLYNNGGAITTALTDSTGKAVFDRQPTNAFDYTVTATFD
jgi:hypothetical protein